MPTLMRRTKWFQKVGKVKTDNVVIIVDSSLPRNEWPKGKVVKVKNNSPRPFTGGSYVAVKSKSSLF